MNEKQIIKVAETYKLTKQEREQFFSMADMLNKTGLLTEQRADKLASLIANGLYIAAIRYTDALLDG